MWKYIGIGLGIVIFLIAMGVAGYGLRWFSAPFTGALEQREITNKGAYRIQAYEQFYGWQEEIDAIDVKLAGYVGSLDNRESTECRGLVARRANIVGDYNAASRAELTQGKWQAPELPQTMKHTERKCN